MPGSSKAGINTRDRMIGSASPQNVTKTASATLAVHEQYVTVDSTAGVMTITMPRAEDAAGNHYSITMTVDNGNVTVAYPGASGQDPADSVLTAVDDYVSLYSSGERWFIESEITT